MTTVYLALGSNVGESQKHLDDAIKLLGKSVTSVVSAPRYVSKAVGYTDQADFLNTVITGETSLTPRELLNFVKQVEKKVGRVFRFRWGPREIDIDIIFYGDEIVDEPDLHIPHQRFAERDFVLKPLCNIAPKVVDPRSNQTVSNIYHKLPPAAQSIDTGV